MLCWVRCTGNQHSWVLKKQNEKGKHVILTETMALCTQCVAQLADTNLHTYELSMFLTFIEQSYMKSFSEPRQWWANGDICKGSLHLIYKDSKNLTWISFRSILSKICQDIKFCKSKVRDLNMKSNIYLQISSKTELWHSQEFYSFIMWIHFKRNI